jgi:ferredoxin
MSSPGRTKVRITVDREICTGSGTCIAVAQTLFDIGDDGTAYPQQSVVEPTMKLDEAISRCPTGAIGALPASPPT